MILDVVRLAITLGHEFLMSSTHNSKFAHTVWKVKRKFIFDRTVTDLRMNESWLLNVNK